MKPAVCVLIPMSTETDDILAVSRRNDFTKWGIPGGKVDPGETNLRAAFRELHEECGLGLNPFQMEPLYVGTCFGADGNHFWVTTYAYTGEVNMGALEMEQGLLARPMSLKTLCSESVSPFAAYNIEVEKAWRVFRAFKMW